MKKSQDIQKLRHNYENVRQKVLAGQGASIKRQQISSEKKTLIDQTKLAQQNQHFENLQELILYRQKYDSMLQLMKEAKQKSYTKAKFSAQAKKIFENQPSVVKSKMQGDNHPREEVSWGQQQPYNNSVIAKSALPNAPSQQINKPSNMIKSDMPRNQNINPDTLMNFFVEKKSQVHPQRPHNFAEILQKPALLTRSFKKKSTASNILDGQIRKLIDDNQKLQDIVRQKNLKTNQIERQKHGMHQDKSKALDRIKQMERQINFLNQDNQRLRTQDRSSKNPPRSTNFNQNSLQDAQNNAHAPYIIKPLNNDLRKITSKNVQGKYIYNYGQHVQSRSGLPLGASGISHGYNFDAKSASHHQRPQPPHFLPQRISNQSYQRGEFFDSFAMVNSQYTSPLTSHKRYNGIKDPVTSTRNKVAFFKTSLILIRDQQHEIAFKRSELNSTMDEIRLIFYINNKTLYEQPIDISYRDEPGNYDIAVKEKLKYVEPNGQGREVLNIVLRDGKELSSIIDVNIRVGDKVYDLWVPANFVNFDYRYIEASGATDLISISPDKQFSSYEDAATVLPLANKDNALYQTVAYLYGRSKIHSGPVKLTWKQNKKLSIQGSPKWLDYLAFILCKYR